MFVYAWITVVKIKSARWKFTGRSEGRDTDEAMCYQKLIPRRVATLYLQSYRDASPWPRQGLSQTAETQTPGQVQTLPKSKTNLLPAAHPVLSGINVSEIARMAPEEISTSGERTCACLMEGNKSPHISHSVGIAGEIRDGGGHLGQHPSLK